MSIRIAEALEVLERTPATLQSLLDGLGGEWLDADEGPETWSPRQVVGHLIHGEETDWVPRARIILEQGEARPFDSFDRFAHLERVRDVPIRRLLDDFSRLRRENLAVVRGWDLTAEQLGLRGRHPALGAVTLGQLLATWTAHDLGHVVQIARVMAKRYAAAVGPWTAYLSVVTAEPRPTGP
jgi:hypothetical protein